MYYYPSVYVHIISGVIVLTGIIYVALYIKKFNTLDYYQMLVLTLLFSIAIGVHGMSHMGLEVLYGYNPYSQITGETIESWHPFDCPYRKYYNTHYVKNERNAE